MVYRVGSMHGYIHSARKIARKKLNQKSFSIQFSVTTTNQTNKSFTRQVATKPKKWAYNFDLRDMHIVLCHILATVPKDRGFGNAQKVPKTLDD